MRSKLFLGLGTGGEVVRQMGAIGRCYNSEGIGLGVNSHM